MSQEQGKAFTRQRANTRQFASASQASFPMRRRALSMSSNELPPAHLTVGFALPDKLSDPCPRILENNYGTRT
jgi:hypothetical protein